MELKQPNTKSFNHYYKLEIPVGDTVYLKIDQVRDYGIDSNLLFSKLHVNKDNNLEVDDRERTKFTGNITSEPTITKVEKTNQSMIRTPCRRHI